MLRDLSATLAISLLLTFQQKRETRRYSFPTGAVPRAGARNPGSRGARRGTRGRGARGRGRKAGGAGPGRPVQGVRGPGARDAREPGVATWGTRGPGRSRRPRRRGGRAAGVGGSVSAPPPPGLAQVPRGTRTPRRPPAGAGEGERGFSPGSAAAWGSWAGPGSFLGRVSHSGWPGMRQETLGLLPFLPGRGLSRLGLFLPALLPPGRGPGRSLLPAGRPRPAASPTPAAEGVLPGGEPLATCRPAPPQPARDDGVGAERAWGPPAGPSGSERGGTGSARRPGAPPGRSSGGRPECPVAPPRGAAPPGRRRSPAPVGGSRSGRSARTPSWGPSTGPCGPVAHESRGKSERRPAGTGRKPDLSSCQKTILKGRWSNRPHAETLSGVSGSQARLGKLP